MKRISVERAFLAARGFVAGEWRLLIPVVLAFLALPPLAVDLLVPAQDRVIVMPAAGADQIPAAFGWLLPLSLGMLLMTMLGGLAITVLALVPGISVREAILIAVRRLPAQIGASLIVGLGLGVGATLVATVGALAGVPLETLQALVIVLVLAGAVALSVRLAALTPLLVDRRVGPWQAIRLAWMISRGALARLFGAMALYVAGAAILVIAIEKALGGVLLLAGYSLGQAEIAKALVAVIDACAGAAMSAGFYILLAALYRELGRTSSGI